MVADNPSSSSTDLAARHAGLALFFEELARDDKNDPRAELIALNAVIRRHGGPDVAFGAARDVPVGTMLLHRAELAVLALHRHFLSEITHTETLGVESILIGPDSRCTDEAERITYQGVGQPSQLAACRRALCINAEQGRPVRVLRTLSASAAAMALRAAGDTAAGKRRREVFRYDGLYRVEVGRLDTESDAPQVQDSTACVLVRLPDQPALPPTLESKA